MRGIPQGELILKARLTLKVLATFPPIQSQKRDQPEAVTIATYAPWQTNREAYFSLTKMIGRYR